MLKKSRLRGLLTHIAARRLRELIWQQLYLIENESAVRTDEDDIIMTRLAVQSTALENVMEIMSMDSRTL